MSLALFQSYLRFAENAVAAKAGLPIVIDPAEFESALVSHGIVLLHSGMEQCFRSALELRCARCLDVGIRAFALSVKKEKAGKIGIDGLKDTLGKFSKGYVLAFKTDLMTSGFEGSWESVKNQRETVAHGGQPATCSLADVRLFYEDVRKILGFFCTRLGLSVAEIASISPLIIVQSPPAAASSVDYEI